MASNAEFNVDVFVLCQANALCKTKKWQKMDAPLAFLRHFYSVPMSRDAKKRVFHNRIISGSISSFHHSIHASYILSL